MCARRPCGVVNGRGRRYGPERCATAPTRGSPGTNAIPTARGFERGTSKRRSASGMIRRQSDGAIGAQNVDLAGLCDRRFDSAVTLKRGLQGGIETSR